LNAFNGKLLAAINQKIQLYKWVLREDGTRELQSECGHHGHILALYVQTRGDFIVVGDLMKSISLLIYKVSLSCLDAEFFCECQHVLDNTFWLIFFDFESLLMNIIFSGY
jgi:hypothetical protein